MNTKKIWQSKTFWAQVATVGLSLIPAVRGYAAANPEQVIAGLAAVNTLLRLATKEKISLWDNSQDN